MTFPTFNVMISNCCGSMLIKENEQFNDVTIYECIPIPGYSNSTLSTKQFLALFKENEIPIQSILTISGQEDETYFYVNSFEFIRFPLLDSFNVDNRSEVVEFIKRSIKVDTLTAEYLLLNAIGMNLSLLRFADNERIVKLISKLRPIANNAVISNATLSNPLHCVINDEQIIHRTLQFPLDSHVTLFFNLSVGNVNAQNLSTVLDLINNNELLYTYAFSAVNIKTNYSFLLTFEEDGMRGLDGIKLKPIVEIGEEDVEEKEFYDYVQFARCGEYFIGETMQKYVQSDYVETRKSKKVDQVQLENILIVAKYLCLSFGKGELDVETYERAKKMEGARLETLAN